MAQLACKGPLRSGMKGYEQILKHLHLHGLWR
jgi:hypothetical protein